MDIDSILYIDENSDIIPEGLDDYIINGGKLDANFQLIKLNILVKSTLQSCQDIICNDEISKEMMKCELNPYNPRSIFAHEQLLDHISLK